MAAGCECRQGFNSRLEPGMRQPFRRMRWSAFLAALACAALLGGVSFPMGARAATPAPTPNAATASPSATATAQATTAPTPTASVSPTASPSAIPRASTTTAPSPSASGQPAAPGATNAGTARSTVTTPFATPIALSGGSGSTPATAAAAADGSIYIIGSTAAGSGCTLFNYAENGSGGAYLGRTPGGLGCTLTLQPASGALDVATQSADGTLTGRSPTSSASFSWADTSGQFSMGSIAADPVPNATGTSDVFLVVRDAAWGLPRIAISHDGGATYTLGDSLISAADIPAGQWQGAGPAPAVGNLVARRDATGLHLFSVIETADSASDRSLQNTRHTDNLNRVYAAIGTVTPGVAPSAAPTVTWHDVEVYHAPIATPLNHDLPSTSVDSAGHVYEAFADGRHVYVKSDLTGLGWNASAAPTAVDSIATGLPRFMNAAAYPAIAAGGNGKVDLAWYVATGGRTTSAALDPRNLWTVFMAQSLDEGKTWKASPVSGGVVHLGASAGALQLTVNQVSGVATVAYTGDMPSPGLPSLFATRQCTGLSAVTGLALVNDCVATQPATPVLPGSTCPGPQIRDGLGDAIDTSALGRDSNLATFDILLVQVVTTEAPAPPATTANATAQQVTLTINRLSSTLPAHVSEGVWRLTWTQATVQRYAQAVLLPKHQPAFTTGVVNADGSLGPGTVIPGGFVPGTNGTISFMLRLGAIGNPAANTPLQNLTAATYVQYSGQGFSSLQLVDRAPDGGVGADYSIGLVCQPASDMPEVPAAALLPVVGGAAAGIIVAVRRRRSRRGES